MELDLTLLLFGSGGLAVLVGAIMHAIKKVWKPENKNWYKLPSGLLSLGAGYFALQGMGVEGFWLNIAVYLVLSLFIMAFQLFSENEAWDDIKGVFLLILKTLRK